MEIAISGFLKIALALSALTWAPPAKAQTAYFKGKTITMVQGRAPGGQGNIRVLALLPILQKHIPGNPAIVSEYMDGGGGRKAANQIKEMVRARITILARAKRRIKNSK